MPKPITDAERIYLKELLAKVVTQSAISLSSTKGYQQLQELIQHGTNEYLSVSTLKRLFGNSSTRPTQVVLDICSQFIGFNSWTEYLNKVRELDRYILQHELSLIIVKQKIDINRIQYLCSKYGHLKEIQTFLFNIIRLAIEQNNRQFFETVFSLPNIFNKKFHSEYDCYYLGQAVALALRSNMQLAKQLTSNYINNPLAVKYCIESFVDEDCFDDYYSHWLLHYSRKKATSEAITFYYTVKYFNAIQHQKPKEAKNIYTKLKAIAPAKLSKIVEARYMAVLLIHENYTDNTKHSNVYKRILQIAQKKNGFYVDYEMYLLRYLFAAKQFDTMCAISGFLIRQGNRNVPFLV